MAIKLEKELLEVIRDKQPISHYFEEASNKLADKKDILCAEAYARLSRVYRKAELYRSKIR